MQTFRTVLEQKIRERRQTLAEFVEYAEIFARENKEAGTLSLRHLQRLIAGHGPQGQPLGPLRPATARLLERIFGRSADELLAPSVQPEPLHAADENTLAMLASIEDHLYQIETSLGIIDKFNGRLDEIHHTLETVIGFDTLPKAKTGKTPQAVPAALVLAPPPAAMPPRRGERIAW